MTERRAWLLFLSSSNYYLYMLLGIYKDLLDTKTKYPIYCGVTEEVDSTTRQILRTIGLKLIELNTSIISPAVLQNTKAKTCEHYFKAFTKLTLFDTPVEKLFDKVVYIDTDVQVLTNIDEVFDYPHMAAIEDNAPCCHKAATAYTVGCSKFCSGLFVWDFKDNPGLGHKILTELSSLDPAIGWHDQSVLNFYHQDWKDKEELHIPPTYGLMNNKANFTAVDFKDIKAIHYTGRLKTGWPFLRPTELGEHQWKDKNCHFHEWLESILDAIKYFNTTYNLCIPLIYPHNIRLITNEEAKKRRADGRSDCFLYF